MATSCVARLVGDTLQLPSRPSLGSHQAKIENSIIAFKVVRRGNTIDCISASD